MVTTEQYRTLDQILAVNTSISIWSARKKLTKEDLGIDPESNELPPEDIASLGSKKLCDPKDLTEINTIKSKAIRYLDSKGVRFLGGWAISLGLTDEVILKLKEYQEEFNEALVAFLEQYEEKIEKWIEDHPDWGYMIRKAIEPAEEVRRKFGFSWQCYKVAPTDNTTVDTGLEDEIDTLGDTLYSEIARVAEKAWESSYKGKSEVSQRALRPLRPLRDKLNTMAFLNPSAKPLAGMIDAAFASIPSSGKISGKDLVMLQGLLNILKDPKSLEEHGNMLLEGQGPEDILWGSSQPVLAYTSTDNKAISIEDETPDEYDDDAPSLGMVQGGLWESPNSLHPAPPKPVAVSPVCVDQEEEIEEVEDIHKTAPVYDGPSMASLF